MKLVRWGAKGAERPGLVDHGGRLRDLGHHCTDLTPHMLAPDGLARLAAIHPESLPLAPADARLGVPLAGVGNLIGIGLNYRDHVAETGMAVPSEPVIFSKHTGSIAGPFDPLSLPAGTGKLDWEVELAVVIGSPAWQVDEADALAHVAGYMIANDISARDWQLERGGQWSKGKSAPGFCPLGPWLVTRDEIPDPQDLWLRTQVNAQYKQDGTSAEMVFGVAFLVAYLSRFMALAPGDVILTGTPAGVGLGRGEFLAAGDLVELTIQGLGRQSIRVA
ncbi:MAG: fumarylacetoacetate hydrolase family protein [Magnetospirillum sp.]|nr:fumarylacetoacetate hydrolase family protein [Magnetospirillum sp.]